MSDAADRVSHRDAVLEQEVKLLEHLSQLFSETNYPHQKFTQFPQKQPHFSQSRSKRVYFPLFDRISD